MLVIIQEGKSPCILKSIYFDKPLQNPHCVRQTELETRLNKCKFKEVKSLFSRLFALPCSSPVKRKLSLCNNLRRLWSSESLPLVAELRAWWAEYGGVSLHSATKQHRNWHKSFSSANKIFSRKVCCLGYGRSSALSSSASTFVCPVHLWLLILGENRQRTMWLRAVLWWETVWAFTITLWEQISGANY